MAQQRGGSKSGKPGQAAPGGAPDISRGKTAAEIEKIEQEAKKLKRETAAVLPADLVKRKAEAEIEKARLDAEKLKREIEAVLPADIVKGKAEAEIEKARLKPKAEKGTRGSAPG